MVLFIIAAVITVTALGVGIYLARKFIKSVVPFMNVNVLLKRLAIIGGVYTLSFATMMISIYLWASLKPQAYELTAAIIGGLLVGLLSFISLLTFMLHYYGGGEKKGISEKLDKWLFRSLVVAFPLLFFSILFLSEGYARFVSYPLPNGISFTSGLTTPGSGVSPNLAFYALCILSGAIYVYFLCDHNLYKEYGKHGICESTFLVAFPAGILGARIFYVVGNWAREFDYGRAMTYIGDFKIWAPLAIWEGGLTILGGAIMGIVVGVAWYIWRNKGFNIWVAIDLIVPTILIAQAVGRWGNFFNCEVHGLASNIENWKWLPRFIWENARYSSVSGLAPEGKIWVPLFLIECFTNMLGYFVIAHVFGIKLRKYTELGDLGYAYVIWYGLTRVFMEPLRDTAFNMGKNGYWSWAWSLVFVVGGCLAIAINHLVRYLMKPKDINRKQYQIGSIVVGVISLPLLITGIIMMSTSSFAQELVFNQFNWGLIVLALGVAILFGLIITLPPLFIKKQETAKENA